MADTLPNDATERKAIPLARGCLDYFPAALAEVAKLSAAGNDQHNPGADLHWDRAKSGDEADALLRHLMQRGTTDTDGMRHSAKVAWRALALLQKELEAAGAPIAPGARNAETVITVKGVPIARGARNSGQRYTLKMDADGTIKPDSGAYYRWTDDLIDRWGGLSDVERDAIRAASPIPGHVACQSGEVVK